MGATAGFDYETWIARYPEFRDTVNETQANLLFAEAQLYHSNDGSGPVRTSSAQQLLLFMIVAHLAQINFGTSDNPPNSGVGRIGTASEGSVSVSFEANYPPGTVQWFQQTKYGSSYWAATTAYRTFRYRPGPRRFFGVPFR